MSTIICNKIKLIQVLDVQPLDVYVTHFPERGCISHNIPCLKKACTDLHFWGQFWEDFGRISTLQTSLFELAPVEQRSCSHLD